MISIVTLFSLSATFFWCFFLLYREMKGNDQCFIEDMRQQTERTDRLYEMFIDLLKEKNERK